jgi:hypothetical protein
VARGRLRLQGVAGLQAGLQHRLRRVNQGAFYRDGHTGVLFLLVHVLWDTRQAFPQILLQHRAVKSGTDPSFRQSHVFTNVRQRFKEEEELPQVLPYFSTLSVSGPSNFTTLAVSGASNFASVAVSGASDLTTLAVSGASNFIGQVTTGSITTGDLHVMGNLKLEGTTDQVNTMELRIEDLTATVAVSATPQADSLADGAGMIVQTGLSGYDRSIKWKYNQGIDYKPTGPNESTNDGRSYFEFLGGNLVLTRDIPADNHVAWDFTNNTYAPDSVATKVSYRFAIGDDEKLSIEKVTGSTYSNDVTIPIGPQAPIVAVFEVPVQ